MNPSIVDLADFFAVLVVVMMMMGKSFNRSSGKQAKTYCLPARRAKNKKEYEFFDG